MIPDFTAEAALPPSYNTYRAATHTRHGSVVVPQQSDLSRQPLNDGPGDGADLAGCGTITCPGCQTCHGKLICC